LFIPFSNIPINLSQRVNQLPPSHNNKDNHFMNQNLSETFNLTEKSELKKQIYDNREYKIISNSTDLQHQPISSPSFPMPCNALWDNISNEKILSQPKNQSNQSNVSSSRNIIK
jgi:hypothetical protein